MSNFNPIYSKFIDDKNAVKPEAIAKGKFYLIKQYEYADGQKENYTNTTAPIIYVLYASVSKDVVHAIKVSNINPNTIKSMFGKMYDNKTENLKLKGGSRQAYNKVISKSPKITNEAYRTYNLSGIKKVILLDMDVTKLVPKNKIKNK